MLLKPLRIVLWLLSLAGVGMFLAVCGARMLYPLELDYIEGVVMDHVVRLSEGKPIYVEPTLEFIPLAYMPLFTSAVAVLGRIFGPALWEPRLILFLSALGTASITVLIVRRETRSWTLAAAGGAVYLIGLGVAGGHYDVARPDSMMMLFTLAGLATLRFTTGARGAVAAGLLMAVAFFTKQHAVWMAFAALIHTFVNDRARLVPFASTIILGFGGGYLLLTWWLGPWFSFYTWEVPSRWSQISPGRLQRYFGERLVGTMGPLTISTVLALLLLNRPWRDREGLWVWMGLGALGTGIMATLDPGSFKHTFIPTILTLAVAGPILIHRLTRRMVETSFLPEARATSLAYAILGLQFLPMIYSVDAQLPRREASRAREELLARLREIPGPVMVPYHGFYTWSAGKGMHFHHLALADILRARRNSLTLRDPGFFDRMFEPLRTGDHRPTIVTDVPLENSGALFKAIAPHYELVGDLGDLSETLMPVTGSQLAPSLVYRPRVTNGGK